MKNSARQRSIWYPLVGKRPRHLCPRPPPQTSAPSWITALLKSRSKMSPCNSWCRWTNLCWAWRHWGKVAWQWPLSGFRWKCTSDHHWHSTCLLCSLRSSCASTTRACIPALLQTSWYKQFKMCNSSCLLLLPGRWWCGRNNWNPSFRSWIYPSCTGNFRDFLIWDKNVGEWSKNLGRLSTYLQLFFCFCLCSGNGDSAPRMLAWTLTRLPSNTAQIFQWTAQHSNIWKAHASIL